MAKTKTRFRQVDKQAFSTMLSLIVEPHALAEVIFSLVSRQPSIEKGPQRKKLPTQFVDPLILVGPGRLLPSCCV
jgi:hypothetical protein